MKHLYRSILKGSKKIFVKSYADKENEPPARK